MSQMLKSLNNVNNTLLILVTLLIIIVLEPFFKDRNLVILLILGCLVFLFIGLAWISFRNQRKQKKLSLNDFLVYPLLLLFGFMLNAEFYPTLITKIIVLSIIFGCNLWNAAQIDLKNIHS